MADEFRNLIAFADYTLHFLSVNFCCYAIHVNLFKACFKSADEVETKLQALSEDFLSKIVFKMINDEFFVVTLKAFMVLLV